MGATAFALIGFGAFYTLLTLVMAFYRVPFALSGNKALNDFAVDGSDLDDFGRRLTRARDNCYETLPIFAVVALGASIAGRLDVTDGLAMWVLFARIGQSVTHLVSTSVPAVLVRATLFSVQMLIYLWWAFRLLTA